MSLPPLEFGQSPPSCGLSLCQEGPGPGGAWRPPSPAKAEVSSWELGSSHPAPLGNGWFFQPGIGQLTPKEWGAFSSSSGHTHRVKTRS